MKAKGYNGTVEFNGQAVIITREGFNARATVGSGSKLIPLRSINAVQWKPPSFLTNGFIEFTISGGSEVSGGAGRTSKNVTNENAVIVTRKHVDEMLALKAAVEAALVAP
ncbi:DUF4429 domain-containing protein [Gordonia sp. ABSL1-1]|uniref:DUF4429 domain-containing protein n=1 Tax=Gordonia sp. ABSL1-1 TaxID=3053923 RepID=UPI00257390B2|nr:DUF4429 domain-containing protein [Gordonia sp. ABSL1-1]MDL9938679.1 DUF4429 domain-containing protein [Gordonia sp. ABSL1-1]